MSTNRLEAMQIFVRVAELASFTRAAEALSIPKPAASVAVQQLETMLGTRLLHRTTRKVQLTQDGQTFYERCQDLLADMDELQTMFRQSPQALRGRLRVDMPVGVARRIVIPALPALLDAHPELEIELSSTDRRVDPVREGFDCVLRIGVLTDSSLIARPLGQLHQVNCASPAYIARYGMPRTLDDLDRHRIVHYVQTLGTKSPGWEYTVDGRSAFRPMKGAVTVSSAESYDAACRAGLGMIQAPVYAGLSSAIADGTLIDVMPDFRPPPMPVSLVYPNRRNLPVREQVFMNWMANLLATHLETASSGR
ncbi:MULTISPECIES: LysR family transcriptional regulator [Ralstonia]|uniref:Transcriptional regulator n=1 Tax=Ralstonia pickettii OR214 TaxID=1264675 RepID=R0EDG4_RALPI|nr:MULTISPECIES: LysR family transcriptional regulator [Ralstonia]MEA3269069.1 LysR family transcriptional regulator [Pseudomonadota bacterium]ENZ80109.1 transcriptional regulator [Ralstonia pickettii OR214]MBL4777411.1 LysR family transcriptional regulator [Ralstonia sp.]MCM3582715.1 LysR family transcriptional regulator [Ralstonia pickettii]MDR9382883.1 LysR family transcriptional regulator [Ralstonia sp. 11b]